MQIKEEWDKQGKVENIIVEGMKDCKENERRNTLMRGFLRDQQKWTSGIQ